ncbi:DUF5815 family protein [Natronomonas sp. EA1]|uniref:DUF5815 family protein n=1 Tax=Natronomonas sp. EA1 TaxID=3421655 RepID=UPI003EB8F0F7
MVEPRVPGTDDGRLELPCGESVHVHDIDLGMRTYECDCGASHAVVTDVHPLSRFVPEFLVEVLRETVDTADDFGEFSMPHLMGIVLEEFPEQVVSKDVSENGHVGYSMLWLTDFDTRRLHAIAVELIVELMEHAISHASDDGAMGQFEEQMLEFDIDAFVEEYRAKRDFDDEYSTPV